MELPIEVWGYISDFVDELWSFGALLLTIRGLSKLTKDLNKIRYLPAKFLQENVIDLPQSNTTNTITYVRGTNIKHGMFTIENFFLECNGTKSPSVKYGVYHKNRKNGKVITKRIFSPEDMRIAKVSVYRLGKKLYQEKFGINGYREELKWGDCCEYMKWYGNIKKQTGFYTHGIKIGKWISYYDDGKVKKEKDYQDKTILKVSVDGYVKLGLDEMRRNWDTECAFPVTNPNSAYCSWGFGATGIGDDLHLDRVDGKPRGIYQPWTFTVITEQTPLLPLTLLTFHNSLKLKSITPTERYCRMDTKLLIDKKNYGRTGILLSHNGKGNIEWMSVVKGDMWES